MHVVRTGGMFALTKPQTPAWSKQSRYLPMVNS